MVSNNFRAYFVGFTDITPNWHEAGHFQPYLLWIKLYQLNLEVKMDIIRVNLTPDKLMESYKKCPLVALKMSIILAFIAHANKGQK